MAKKIPELTRAWFESNKLPWPPASNDIDGTEFVRCEQMIVQPQFETLRYLQPSYPLRRVAVAFAYDEETDEEWPTEYRDMTDAEWNEALASYEKAMREWRRTHGTVRRKTGPDILDATFVTKGGARAVGRLVRGTKQWTWLEWSMTTSDRSDAPSSRS